MRSSARVARPDGPTSRSSISRHRSPTGSRSSFRARLAAAAGAAGAAASAPAKVSLASATARPARRAARDRPGYRSEDRRLAADPRAAAVGRRPRRDSRHRARSGRAASRPRDAVSTRSPGPRARLARGPARRSRPRARPQRTGSRCRGRPGAVAAIAAAAATLRSTGTRAARARGASRLAPPGSGGVGSGCTSSIGASSPPASGEPAGAQVVVTGAATRSPFAVRVAAEVRRFDGVELRERVLLELPVGRAPPQGAVLELRARPVAPRGPETGFDERGWLARRGIHVVLHASGSWQHRRPAGRDRRRGRPAAHGNRERARARDDGRAPVARRRRRARRRRGNRPRAPRRLQGVGPLPPACRLGTEHRLHRLRRPRPRVRGRARAGGRSHARDRRDPRATRSRSAGSRPSCVRQSPAASPRSRGCCRVRAIAGTRWRWVRSSFWPGRRDRCSSPDSSSRSPRLRRSSSRCRACAACRRAIRCRRRLVEVIGISAACGVVTAPILWLQFGAIPLWTVPANALAEPAMPVLLGLRPRSGGARAR